MLETSVSEIHGYPLRPEGFEEPLFPSRESRLAVGEHLLKRLGSRGLRRWRSQRGLGNRPR